MPTLLERVKAQDRVIADAEDRLARAHAQLREARRMGLPAVDLERAVVVAERVLFLLNERRDDLCARIDREKLVH